MQIIKPDNHKGILLFSKIAYCSKIKGCPQDEVNESITVHINLLIIMKLIYKPVVLVES